MIQIKKILWDDWNTEHIKKHEVTVYEVEEICSGKYKEQLTYSNRIMVLGRTIGGRALAIILSEQQNGEYYVVTARDMSKKERKKFL